MTEDQDFQIGEETTLKDTKYELLIVIANQGYSGLIMDAARSETRAAEPSSTPRVPGWNVPSSFWALLSLPKRRWC